MYVYYGTNDWWDYLRARPTNDILAHSAKGKKWDSHKYIGITPGGSYIYPKSVMKGWSSYVEPVGPKAPKYAKPGYSGQGPRRRVLVTQPAKLIALGTRQTNLRRTLSMQEEAR